mgnify:CR=1 FL=1|tara:strand:- start:1265 stop:1453 length:189 start_codon:yes stop_codon:yes gene_type:complete
MVNKKLTDFCKGLKNLQIPKIQKGFEKEVEKEVEILHGLGVECYEIEFLIELRIKEELIIEN